jgi:transcriptional regulator with XRE-family HTH domain
VTLGQLLKSGRIAAGLTQREVAQRIKCSFTYISKIENDRLEFPPSDTHLMLCAAFYRLDPDDVLHAAGKPPPDLVELLRRDREIVRLLRNILTQKETKTPT